MTRHRLALKVATRTAWMLAALALSVFVMVPATSAQPDHDSGKALLGQNLYRSYCATCHGASGEGDGPLAEVLTVAPGNLTLISARNNGEFPVERTRKIIDGREKVRGHGTADMPAWGDAFQAVSDSDEDVAKKIDQLVHYLLSIQADAAQQAHVNSGAVGDLTAAK